MVKKAKEGRDCTKGGWSKWQKERNKKEFCGAIELHAVEI